ncbi:HEAT repeat domain-containing protein [Planctomycetota bacterium]
MQGRSRRIAIRAAVTGLVLLCSGIVFAQEDDPKIKGKPLSKWIEQLRGTNRGLQMRAAQALSAAPTNLHSRIAPQVIPVLKSERENDKFVAAQVLGVYGPVSRTAVPDLLPMLGGTQYERNRAAAAKALGQILKGAEPSDEIEKITQELIRLFDDKYMDVRREAVTACGMIGLAAKSCIPALPKRIGDAAAGNSITREAGKYEVWACGEFGPLAACHIDRLISIMHGGPVAETVEAIGKIGAVNDSVVPNIVDRMELVATGTVIAQEGYRTPRMSREAVREYMEKSFEALSRFGPKSAPAISYMVSMISAKGWERNKAYALGALKVLGAIGPAAKEAIKPIESNCLTSSDADIKNGAVAALAGIRGAK